MPKGEANPPDPRGSARRAEFEALHQQHSREVWALAYARWMDSDLAMDITQEAFLRLWKQWEAGGEDIQNPRAWLLRVRVNVVDSCGRLTAQARGVPVVDVAHLRIEQVETFECDAQAVREPHS